MITSTIKGNLITHALAGRYRAIIHGANTQCAMGAGIAPQIAKVWPAAEEADNKTVSGDVRKLGGYTYAPVELAGETLFVFNAYTQHYFRQKPDGSPAVDYKALGQVFKSLNNFLRTLSQSVNPADVKPVGIPMIGAGLAGGDWAAIQTIINLATPDISIELVIFDG